MKSGVRKSPRYRIVTIVSRALIGIVSIYVVINIANPLEIGQAISALTTRALLYALLIHAIIIMGLAWRWVILVRAMGSVLNYVVGVRITFLSTVLNLTLPTSIGGDIGRVWFGQKQGVTLITVSAAAVFDRGVGLATLILLVAAGAVLLGGNAAVTVLVLTLVAGVVLLTLFLRWARRLPEAHAGYRFAEATHGVLGNWPIMFLVITLSLGCHLAAAIIATLLADGMGLQLSAMHAVLLFPAVLLAALIPVSIGGWGLRELAAIPVLTLAGMDAEGAAAVSLAFGLTQLGAALLGTLIGYLPHLWRTVS